MSACRGLSTGHSNNVIGRVDYHPNDKNSINGEYFFGQAITTTPNAGEPSFWDNLNVSRTQMMRAVWIYTPNSNWVNDVRFGYNRYNLADGNAECSGKFAGGQPNYTALGFISGANPPSPFCGFPVVNFSQFGFPSLGAAFFLNDQGVFQYTYTAYDNVSYTHGKPQLQVRFRVPSQHFPRDWALPVSCRHSQLLRREDHVSPNPCTDLQNFLAGSIGEPGKFWSIPSKKTVSSGFNREALYFEDNFRVSSRVTMDLGLRYELEPAIRVDNNNAGNFDPFSPTGMVQQNGIPLYKA